MNRLSRLVQEGTGERSRKGKKGGGGMKKG